MAAICDICGKVCKNSRGVKIHARTHKVAQDAPEKNMPSTPASAQDMPSTSMAAQDMPSTSASAQDMPEIRAPAPVLLFLDTETSGYFGKEMHVVEVAVIVMTEEGQFVREWSTLVIQNRAINRESTKIHGITTKMTKSGKQLHEVLDRLLHEFREASLIIGHNIVKFDIERIREESTRANHALHQILNEKKYFDTMSLCSKLGLPNKKLQMLYEHFYEPSPGAHRARYDTAACARCYFKTRGIDIILPGEPAILRKIITSIPRIESAILCDDPARIEPAILCDDPARALPTPSAEQAAIIGCFAQKNIIVDAVAGSGKTTLALHIMLEYPADKFLLITYNRRLCDETIARCEHIGIVNTDVMTYHGFAGKYLNSGAGTDSAINRVIDKNFARPVVYDAIIVDELQDMTPIYYKLIMRVLKELPNAKLCLIGDKYQSIYGFNSATTDYIDRAEELFPSPREFARMPLFTSYRLTREASVAINSLIGCERLIGSRTGAKIRYTGMCMWDDDDTWFCLGRDILRYKPQDIMILAPSVKSAKKLPFRTLTNRLSKCGIDVYIPGSNDMEIPRDCVDGKVLVCSYHQSKGTERKLVILYGFDASYFKYYAKESPQHKLANPQYVALTRAKEQLIIVKHLNNSPCMFQSQDFVNLCEEDGILGQMDTTPVIQQADNKISATKLCNFAPFNLIDAVVDSLQITNRQLEFNNLNLRITTTGRNQLIEQVADITGNAVAYWYAHERGLLDWEYLINCTCIAGSEEPKKMREIFRAFADQVALGPLESLDISGVLKLATIINAMETGLVHRLYQITSYDWLTERDLAEICDRLFATLGDNCAFEIPHHGVINKITVAGRIDCIDFREGARIYELKLARETKNEHLAQLAIYAYLTFIRPIYARIEIPYEQIKFTLFNMQTGELMDIVPDIEKLGAAIRALVDHKIAK